MKHGTYGTEHITILSINIYIYIYNIYIMATVSGSAAHRLSLNSKNMTECAE